MNLLTALMRPRAPVRSSSFPAISLDDWAAMFSLGSFPIALNQTLVGDRETVDGTFAGLVQGAYRSNGVVFACMLARFLLFSEARFQFQQMRGGRPGDLFGTPDLLVLERPEPGKTTGDLLARAIVDADLAGNFFAARRAGRIKRMRPDWVTIVLGSQSGPQLDGSDLDAEVVGYFYQPGGPGSRNEPIPLVREQVAHFAPIPDPLASYRGMSWLIPVIREIMGDGAATTHKLKFFENGATPNMVVSLDVADPAKFKEWIELFEQNHKGVLNAYKTLYLGSGANAEVVGANLRQLDFKAVQGAGETRIAAAAGVPPIIVGLSEGLQAATYSNYGQARRRFADGTMRPLWRNMAGSLESIIPPPAGSRLWYDDRDIPFLAEDQKDAAEVLSLHALAIRNLSDAGYEPASVIDAVTAGDLKRLKHTGNFSVQLQPVGANASTSPSDQAGRALAALIAPHANGREHAP